MWNMIYLVTGFVFIILLLAIFYSKEVISSNENIIFKRILVTNIICYLTEIPLQILVRTIGIESILIDVFCRLYLISISITYSIFTIYVFTICLNKNSKQYEHTLKKCRKIILISQIIVSIFLFFLPFEKFYDISKMFIQGQAIDLLKGYIAINIILYIVLLLRNHKELKNKKYLPIYFVIVCLVFMTILNSIDPSVLITTMIGTFICYTMYFTIENPDIKMLNEMYKNKELMEQNYEDKYNFLFEMTQEARNPLVNINNAYNEIRNEDDPKKIKEGLMAISNLVKQLDFSINNVLNISSLDVQKIKVVNSKYDLEKLCSELELKVKNELLKKDVEFTLSLPKQMPILYGDYMKIRQILYSLLINACKNTEKGSITLKVNLIEKYDVCRIIFNISDTGRGMPIEKVNEIISATGELEKDEIDNLEKKEYNVKVCQKVVKIMGGNLMIKSNIGEGTEVNLTIDQRVYHEKDKSVLAQYEEEIANYRKVLIVSQNKEVINIIKKKFSANHITSSVLYYGMDAIDKIKSGKKYDFILIEDEMKEMTGFMTLKGMKEIKDFDTPSIIMLKEDKEHIKDHFMEDGFSDAIIMDNLDNELDRIIEKY